MKRSVKSLEMPAGRASRQNSKNNKESEDVGDQEKHKTQFQTKDATQWMMLFSGKICWSNDSDHNFSAECTNRIFSGISVRCL